MNNQNNIGYKNPPVDTQFKKGQSGNKNGRPKGSKKLDINNILQKELNNKILTKDGQSMTKLDAAVKQIVNKSATGDIKSTKVMLSMINKADDFDLAGLFSDKLLKEGFINQEDIKNYIYNSKHLVTNKKFTATDKIDYEIFRKNIMAFEGIKTEFILYHINMLIMNVFLSTEIFITIERETSFWGGVKNSLALLNTPEQKTNKIIKELETEREYVIPNDDLYHTALAFQEISYRNIFICLSGYIKLQKNRQYYEDQKRYWFSSENQNKFYKIISKEDMDAFQIKNESFYNKDFINYVEETEVDLDSITEQKVIQLIKWYKGE